MKGDLVECRDYSTKNRRMQTTFQNSYFTERFGRNDFEPIDTVDLASTASYLLKYIEKSGERIVYSNDGLIFYTEDHYKSFEQLY
jgi:guanyl-specific ribonuclease Sa